MVLDGDLQYKLENKEFKFRILLPYFMALQKLVSCTYGNISISINPVIH